LTLPDCGLLFKCEAGLTRPRPKPPETETETMKPNNPYNRALADLTDYVNRRIKDVETDLDDCVDNDGSDKRFYRLCGRRNELAGLYLELRKLEQPEQPAKPARFYGRDNSAR